MIGSECSECCGNPPPPPEPPDFCLCPDDCSYYVSIVSPAEAALNGQTEIQPCTDNVAEKEFSNATGCDVDQDEGTARIQGLSGNVQFRVVKHKSSTEQPGGGYINRCVSGTLDVGVLVRCSSPPPAFEPVFEALVYWQLEVENYNTDLQEVENTDCTRAVFANLGSTFRRVRKEAVISLPSGTCAEAEGRFFCDGNPRTVAPLTLPLSLALGEADADGQAWTVIYDFWTTGQTEWDEELEAVEIEVEECLAGLTAEFAVGKRQACRAVECDCGASLDGLVVRVNGGELDEPAEFIYGTADEFTYEDDDGWRVYSYDGGSQFIVYTYLDATGENYVKRQIASIGCESVGSPAVPRWFANFSSDCAEYGNYPSNVATAATTDAWIGYFICYESEGCADVAEGDPVPIGDPVDVERQAGYPSTAGGVDPCDPPGRLVIELVEDCGS